MSKNIIVVGGGAAGMLAAYFAAEAGNKITRAMSRSFF